MPALTSTMNFEKKAFNFARALTEHQKITLVRLKIKFYQLVTGSARLILDTVTCGLGFNNIFAIRMSISMKIWVNLDILFSKRCGAIAWALHNQFELHAMLSSMLLTVLGKRY